MAGTPYHREQPTPEEVEEAKAALRKDIAKFAEAIAEDRPAGNDDSLPVTLGKLCHRAATLACVILHYEHDSTIPPSIFLGQVAGVTMEGEMEMLDDVFTDHAQNN